MLQTGRLTCGLPQRGGPWESRAEQDVPSWLQAVWEHEESVWAGEVCAERTRGEKVLNQTGFMSTEWESEWKRERRWKLRRTGSEQSLCCVVLKCVSVLWGSPICRGRLEQQKKSHTSLSVSVAAGWMFESLKFATATCVFVCFSSFVRLTYSQTSVWGSELDWT